MAVDITIDMSGMNSVTLSGNKTSASVHSLELNRFQIYVPGDTPFQLAVLWISG